MPRKIDLDKDQLNYLVYLCEFDNINNSKLNKNNLHLLFGKKFPNIKISRATLYRKYKLYCQSIQNYNLRSNINSKNHSDLNVKSKILNCNNSNNIKSKFIKKVNTLITEGKLYIYS